MELPAAHRGRASALAHPIPGLPLPSGPGSNPIADAAIPRDALLALLVSAALTFTLGAFLQIRVDFGVGLVLTEIVCIAAPALLVLRRHPSLRAPPAFSRPRASRIARIAVCAALAAIGPAALGVGTRRIIGSVLDPAAINISLTPASLALAIIGLWVLAPVCEELLFRVTLQRALGRALPAWASVLSATTLFAVYHGALERIPETFALGLFLGVIYLRTRSYWTAVAFHAVSNIVGPLAFVAAANAPAALLALLAGPATLAAIWMLPRTSDGLAPGPRSARAWPILTAIASVIALGVGVESVVHVRTLRTGYNIAAFPQAGWCEQEWSLGAHEVLTVSERITLMAPTGAPDRLTPVAPGATLTSASIDGVQLLYTPGDGAWTLDAASPVGRRLAITWSVPLAALEQTGDIFWLQTRAPVDVSGYRVECILEPGCNYIDPRDPARVRDTPYVANVLPGDVLHNFPRVGLTIRRAGAGSPPDQEVPHAEGPDA